MNLASDVMTKGDFAAAIKVSPGRVSQYISSGQIHGPALEGEGRNARIVASIAMQQLQRTLDPSQRFGGNGAALKAGTDLFPAGTQPSSATTGSKPTTLPPSPQVDELAELRIRRERVATERAEREEQLEIGRYMLAEDARREIAKAVAAAFAVMDQGIAEIASELSEKFSVPQRDLQYALTKSFRGVRERAAATFQEMAADEPKFVEDGEGEEDSE